MRNEPFEWIDPWEEIAEAQAMQDRWYEREEYFREDMRLFQQATADNTYVLRRQIEKLIEDLVKAKGVTAPPPILARRPHDLY